MRAAAFFDLDRCVIAGSSTYYFGKAALKWGVYRRGDLVRSAVRSARHNGAADRQGRAVCEHLLGALEGCSHEQLDVLVPDALGPILADVHHELYVRILEHEAAGVPTYLCSASPVELVEVVAGVLNMSGGVIATAAATDEQGRFTGELAGPFCYGAHVAEAMRREAEKVGLDLADSWAYGNSLSDAPMLDVVGKPVAVNPDPELRVLAETRGWEILRTQISRPARNLAVAAGVATGALAAAVAGILWATRRPGHPFVGAATGRIRRSLHPQR